MGLDGLRIDDDDAFDDLCHVYNRFFLFFVFFVPRYVT